MTRAEITKAEAMLKENGIEAKNLAVFILGPNEMIIGETYSPEVVGDYAVRVENPKRYLRLQQVSNQGITINLVLLDLDALMGRSCMDVRAVAGYFLRDQSPEGQLSTYALFTQYFKVRAANRATEAGLIVPSGTILQRG